MSYADQFVVANNLRPGDAVLLKKKFVAMFDHFAIYIGRHEDTNQPVFAANHIGGVQIIKPKEADQFLQQLVPRKIERFSGSLQQRKDAIQRAISMVGKRGYNLIFNNCEHYKNFVQFGEKYSKQVDNAGSIALLTGGAAVIGGLAAKNKKATAIGVAGLVLGALLKVASDQGE